MHAYVFSKPESDDLQTPIFATGEHGREESTMLFTEADLASRFQAAAGWQDEEVVVELDAIPLLKWLIRLHESGTRYLVIDPDPEKYQQQAALPTMTVEDLLQDSVRELVRRFRLPISTAAERRSSVKIFSCQSCGNTVEQRLGNVTPVCCDRPMLVEANAVAS